MSVKLYVEGGGSRAELRIRCRKAFSDLLCRAGFAGRLPRVVACGSRNEAFDQFKSAVSGPSYYPILLVDSEDLVANGNQPNNPSGAWRHLESRDDWQRPNTAHDDQAQLMVTCMETWLMADRDALLRHFRGMNQNRLLPDVGLEGRDKQDVNAALDRATSPSRRGSYTKGRDSFDLLSKVEPTKLKSKLPHFQRLIKTLDNHL